MPGKNGDIRFGIGFDVDKKGLQQLQKSLQNIQKATTKDLVGNMVGKQPLKELNQIQDMARDVQVALKKAYNPTVGSTNISKFNKQLEASGYTLQNVYDGFSKLGIKGQTAFNNVANSILTTNMKLKETRSLIDTMGTTMMNTVKWGIASSIMNTFTGSIQNAYNYVKVLDSSLTDIRIVTGDSREQMDKFAKSANEAAQALGRQTKEYTNAALSFYQQGLSDSQVAARTEATLKASNITGASTETMADQLTAVWNGFQIQAQNTEEVVSKMAAVADTSASNMSQLATAMSKVASVANNMGVDVDQLNAQIATIIATTRQAPETVGNALKTIYARINDIKAGTDQAQMSLGNYTGKMASLGINVLDATGHLRDTGEVMEQIGERWSTMTREQQIYLTQTMAGQRQMNNLMALFENWDMYAKELNVSLQAQGTLDEKNARYMESLAAHTKEFEAAQEGLIQSLTDSDSFKGFIDFGTLALNTITKLVDAIGGGGTALLGLGSIAASVFSGVISRQLNSIVVNLQNARYNQQQLNNVLTQANAITELNGITQKQAAYQTAQRYVEIDKYYSVMSQSEIDYSHQLIKEIGLLQQQKAQIDAAQNATREFLEKRSSMEKIDFKTLFDDNNSDQLNQITGILDRFKDEIDEAEKAWDKFKEKGFDGHRKAEEVKVVVQALKQLQEEVTGKPVSEEWEKNLRKGLHATGQQADQVRGIINRLISEAKTKSSEMAATIQNSNGKLSQTQQKLADVKAAYQQLKKEKEQAFNIKTTVEMVGAVSQLTYAFSALNNIGTIWADKNASSGEKVLKTFMSLLTVVPQILNGYSKLNKVILDNAKARDLAAVSEATEVSTATANTIATQAETIEKDKNTIASGKEALGDTTAATAKSAHMKAALGLTAALKAAIIVVGLAAVAYGIYTSQQQKSRQETIDNAEASIKKAKAEGEELQAEQKLYQNYLKAYDQYKVGKITKQQMGQAAQALAGYLDEEAIAVANLTGHYEDLTVAAKKALRSSLEEQKSSLEARKTNLEIQSKAKFLETKAGKSEFGNTQRGFISITPSATANFLTNRPAAEAQLKAMQMISTGMSNAIWDEENNNISIFTDYSIESIQKTVEEIDNIIKQVGDDQAVLLSKPIQTLKTFRNQIGEYYDQIIAYQKDASTHANFFEFSNRDFFEDIESLDQFRTAYASFLDWMKKNNQGSEKQIKSSTDSLIRTYGGEIANKYLERMNNIEAITSKFRYLIQDDVRKKLESLSDEELTTLLNVKFSIGKSEIEDIDEALNQAKLEIQKKARELGVDSLKSISEAFKEGGQKNITETISTILQGAFDLSQEEKNKISEIFLGNKSLTKQVEEYNKLLKERQEILENTNLKGNIEETKATYENAREQLNKKIDNAASAGDTEGLKQYQALLEATNEEYKKYLSDIGSKNYISEQYINNMAEGVQLSFDQISNTATLLSSISTKIGEDYTVSSEDLAFLLANMPELAEGMQDLGTGYVKLSEQSVKLLNQQSEALVTEKESLQQRYIDYITTLQNLIKDPTVSQAIKETAQEILNSYTVSLAQMRGQVSTATGQANNAVSGKGGNFDESKVKDELYDFQSKIDEYLKGIDLSGLDDKELQQYLNQLDQLEKQFPKLKNQIELLRNTGLSTTEEYQKALQKIKQTLDDLKLKEKISEAEAVGEQLSHILQVAENRTENGLDLAIPDKIFDDFYEKLREYTDAQYTIDIEIHSNAEDAFEGIEDRFKQITDAANKIGQSFTVSGKDLRELNAAFPGILQGMEMLADGSYQLNQQVAENAIQGASAEVAAEAKSISDRLALQAQLLRDKAQIYTQMADAAARAAAAQRNGQAAAASDIAIINQGVADLKQKNSQLAATKQIEDQEAVAGQAQQAGRVTAANWTEAARQSANAMYQFAVNACQNMAEVAKGENGAPQPPSIDVGSFVGTSTSGGFAASSFEASQNFDANAYNESFEVMQAQFRALAEASEKAAGDIDGMLAQIGANANSIADGIRNVQEGRGFSDNGTSSKKGGGGSGSKTKSADEIDKLKLKDEDVDRYHQIQRAIKRIDDYLDAMSGYEEKAIRKGKSATIDKQVDALEQQKALYEQKIQLMQQDLQMQQANLSALGVQFDEQGNIINYTALMSAYQAEYNMLLEQAKLLTGSAQEAKLNEASALKSQLDSLKSQMGAYQSLQDQIMGAGAAIRDIIDKEEELRIKQFKIQIDVQLDLFDAKQDWNEFRKSVIEKIKDDDFLGQAKLRLDEFFDYYNDQGTGIIQSLTEHVNKTRREVEIIENGGISSIYGMNEAQAVQDMMHYTEELMSKLEDVQQIVKDIHDLYLDTIDAAKDAFDDEIDQYEQINKLLEHDINMLDLLNFEDKEERLANLYNQQIQNSNQELARLRTQTDYWKQMMDAAQQGSEEWFKFRDNWQSSLNDLNDQVEKSITTIITKYETSINKITTDMRNSLVSIDGKAVTGAWDKAEDEWDKILWLQDRYLDKLTKANSLANLQDERIGDLADKSQKTQQILLDLTQAQVEKLREKEHLTQKDLKQAELEYQLQLKQLALQEAQQNKTTMRLRRDSQGNYTYQYVEDQDDINNKQMDVRNAAEELRIFIKEQLPELINEMMTRYQEFSEKMGQAAMTYKDNEEALAEETARLTEEYFGEQGYITLLREEFAERNIGLIDATGHEADVLFTTLGDEFKALLGLEEESEGGIWPSLVELMGEDGKDGKIPTVLNSFHTDTFKKNLDDMSKENQDLLFNTQTGLYPTWGTAMGNIGNASGKVTEYIIKTCMQSLVNANHDYLTDVNNVTTVAAQDFSLIGQAVNLDAQATYQLAQIAQGLTDVLMNQVNAAGQVYNSAQQIAAGYSDVERSAIAAANAVMKLYAALQGVAIGDYYTPTGFGGSATVPKVSGAAPATKATAAKASGKTASAKGTFAKPAEVEYTYKVYDAAGYNSKTYEDLSKQEALDKISFLDANGDNTVWTYEAIPVIKPVKMATGGYTGEWSDGGMDDDGKLAILHQKELVLNEGDTEKFLQALQVADVITQSVQQLVGSFDAMMNAMIQGTDQMVQSMVQGANMVSQILNQSVNINADFSGVDDANEIKQALNSLSAKASQYATPNRRSEVATYRS